MIISVGLARQGATGEKRHKSARLSNKDSSCFYVVLALKCLVNAKTFSADLVIGILVIFKTYYLPAVVTTSAQLTRFIEWILSDDALLGCKRLRLAFRVDSRYAEPVFLARCKTGDFTF